MAGTLSALTVRPIAGAPSSRGRALHQAINQTATPALPGAEGSTAIHSIQAADSENL
jgi:hypothetical protein